MGMHFGSPLPAQNIGPRALNNDASVRIREHPLHLPVETLSLLSDAAEQVVERFALNADDGFESLDTVISCCERTGLHLQRRQVERELLAGIDDRGHVGRFELLGRAHDPTTVSAICSLIFFHFCGANWSGAFWSTLIRNIRAASSNFR